MEKKVKAITSRDVDFAKWYTDVVVKSGLAAYSNVRGCIYIPPYGTALWDLFKSEFDNKLKTLGYSNVMFPLLMPKSLLQKEKDHITGFSPEVATIAGEDPDPLLIRPTSEALFCDYFAKNLQSYKELPLRLNQWANIVRLEKNTRPFLRTTEFFWQEGHALFATEEEARTEARKIHKLYEDFVRDLLAIPVVSGQKTESEKFAGAVDTYTIESMMYDGQALQSATSHYLGDGFMRAFGVKVQGKEGEIYPHYVTFGITTRMIGGIVMVHGDDNGLVLPPRVAPTQVVLIPIKAVDVSGIKLPSIRFHVDNSDNSPGWKFAEYEMKGIPLRIEIGPRDLEAGDAIVSIRYSGEKRKIKIDDLPAAVPALLDEIHEAMYAAAKNRLDSSKSFIYAPWCGSEECETNHKKKTGMGSRCIVGESKGKCVVCGKAGKHEVVWGRAY
ncbi:MAG: proline--tRNA ligase [Firmicutes bacterium]|nr:proline--tRNA ligase [Bacillota bacterium]